MASLPVLPPVEERAFQIHHARVRLAEASRRRHQPGYHAYLLSTIGQCRREAAAIDIQPAQGTLSLTRPDGERP